MRSRYDVLRSGLTDARRTRVLIVAAFAGLVVSDIAIRFKRGRRR